MKTKLLLLIAMISIGAVHAQYCWKTINTISTKPGAQGSVNTFDWTQELGTVYLMDEYNPLTGSAPARQFTLPMYTQGSGSVFNNLNLIDFQDTDPLLKDHKPQDGWELLVKEFGAPSPKDKTVENPYFALYNRYTSKIRVFIMLTSKAANLNLTGAYLKLSFAESQRKTALLQHASPVGQSVVFLETDISMKVPNYMDNRNYYWFFADFPVAYDPCTCSLLDKSKLIIQLIANEDALIEAKINGQLYEKAVNDKQPGSTEKSIGMNLIDPKIEAIFKGVQKGFESYKTYDGYRKNFEKGIGQIDDYLVKKINKQLQDKYPYGVTFEESGITVAPTVSALKQGKEGVNFLQGLNYGANQLAGFKSIASAIPYVGAAIGLIDFFSSMSKKNTATSPTPTPTTFSVDLNLNGSIKKTSAITSYSFITPGTQTGPPGSGIPDYNNILGVVNILDIPALEYVEYTPQVPSWNAYQLSSINTAIKDFIPNIRQYRMSGDLKYVLNPASNLEVISVDATYILEFGSGANDVIFRTAPYSTNLWRDVDQMPVEFGKPDAHANNIPQRMEDAGWETDYLSSGYFDYMTKGTGVPQQGKYRIRTPYAPIQCLRNVAFNLYYHTKTDTSLTSNDVCCRNRPPNIILKVLFKLRKKNNVDDDVISMVLSYDMTKAKEDAKPAAGFAGLHYNLDRYIEPGNSFFYNYYPHSFTTSPAFPSAMNAPKNITLQQTSVTGTLFAQDTIFIKDNVYLGNNAHLYAGKVIITNASFFSPASGYSTLNIGKYISCDASVQSAEESPDKILAKCQSQTYKERALSRSESAAIVTREDIGPEAGSFVIYPNPTSDYLFVKFMSSTEAIANIELFDLSGRKLFADYNKSIGTKPYAMDMKRFAAGTYFVKVTRTNGIFQTFKFVKQ